MRQFRTTSEFISSHVKSSGYSAGEIIEMLGYSNPGDEGTALWKATGNTIAASQDVIATNDIKISDASGNEFELVATGIIDLNALGGTGGAYVTIATNAGLVWSQSFTSIPSSATLNYDTVSDMVNASGLSAGNAVETAERSTGNGGGGTYDVVLTTSVTPNGQDIIQGVADNTISFVLRRNPTDEILASTFGGVLDDSTDNTAIVQACIDRLSATPINNVDRGGKIIIPRFMNFNLKSLTFVKRQTLIYFIGDDISTTPSTNLNTNELVTFQANANNAGIVNEERFTAPFAPGFGIDVRKDVTGHTGFLGGGQSQDNPARASYNIFDEQVDVWRIVWENYNTATDFTGVKMHYWIGRITITGITTASFSTVPTKGTIITGTTSGAKGHLYSIDGSEMLLTWISGEFQAGETVSDDDETTTDTISTQALSLLTATNIGWSRQDGQIMLGLPTNLENSGQALNVGGKVLAQNTRAFGQFNPVTTTSPGYVWLDDLDAATPAGLEVTMDTTVSAGRERLELCETDGVTSGLIKGHVGATNCYTNFSNSVLSATTDFNVASIVRNGTGDYTITFANAFNRADYTVALAQASPNDHPYIFSQTTTTLRIRNVAHGTTTPLVDLAGQIHVTCSGGDF